jgi:cysteinyl-tRNA synthetase
MATLRLYNTLTRSKESFTPIDPANVRMYACGPTVYDFAHIGNARPVVVFDVLFRLLRHLYGPDHVTYVRNVTDVDDKINARAAERGVSIRNLTDGTLEQFHQDIRALGVLSPEDVNEPGKPPRFIEPRATDHIAEMKALIERLVAGDHAYVAADNVLFHVPSMPDYGVLSKRPLDEMEAGARVDVAPYKRSPLDFVLWKPSKPGEPAWPSPCGIAAPGRPGWHIECSAMAWRHLGETFDIHAGGIDLVFPHHENEIAQSRCCFDAPVMANVWLHNGFLQVEGEKMAKSAGNFVTIRELLATDKFGGRSWPGEALRLAMLRTHYRQPIDWTVRALEEAERTLDRWYKMLAEVGPLPAGRPSEFFLDPLLDDLNTPAALGELHGLFSGSQEAGGGSLAWNFYKPDHAAIALASARTLGLLNADPAEWEARKRSGLAIGEADIQKRILARAAARTARNFAESDRIRDELAAMGVRLKDNKDGTTTWEVAP